MDAVFLFLCFELPDVVLDIVQFLLCCSNGYFFCVRLLEELLLEQDGVFFEGGSVMLVGGDVLLVVEDACFEGFQFFLLLVMGGDVLFEGGEVLFFAFQLLLGLF